MTKPLVALLMLLIAAPAFAAEEQAVDPALARAFSDALMRQREGASNSAAVLEAQLVLMQQKLAEAQKQAALCKPDVKPK